MNLEALQNWLTSHNAEDKSINCFWNYINNYKVEDSEEFTQQFGNYSLEELKIKVESVSIRYANYPDFNYNHIVIDISVRFTIKKIATYRVLFNFDGSVDDDMLFID